MTKPYREPAPLAFFCFHDTDAIARSLDLIALDEEARTTRVLVYIDGAKDESDSQAIDRVSKIVSTPRGFRSVRTVRLDRHVGAINAMRYGSALVANRYGRAIVVEERMPVSADTLSRMNGGLADGAEASAPRHVNDGLVYPGLAPKSLLIAPWAIWKNDEVNFDTLTADLFHLEEHA